jgi:hypothetical protein
MDATHNNKPFSLLSETLIIAAITFSGYLTVYCYEFGFCIAKYIPTMLIQVSLEDVLRSMLITVPIVLLLVFGLTALEEQSGLNTKVAHRNYFFIYVLAFGISIVLFVLVGVPLTLFVLMLIIWLLPMLAPIIQAIVESKTSRRDIFEILSNTEPRILSLDKSVSREILYVLVISLFIISSSFILGMLEAKHFRGIARYTLEDGQYLFLRRYGDSIVLRRISPQGDEISKSVEVKTLCDISSMAIATEPL